MACPAIHTVTDCLNLGNTGQPPPELRGNRTASDVDLSKLQLEMEARERCGQGGLSGGRACFLVAGGRKMVVQLGRYLFYDSGLNPTIQRRMVMDVTVAILRCSRDA